MKRSHTIASTSTDRLLPYFEQTVEHPLGAIFPFVHANVPEDRVSAANRRPSARRSLQIRPASERLIPTGPNYSTDSSLLDQPQSCRRALRREHPSKARPVSLYGRYTGKYPAQC